MIMIQFMATVMLRVHVMLPHVSYHCRDEGKYNIRIIGKV